MRIWYRNEDSGGAKVCYVASAIIAIVDCILAYHQIRKIISYNYDSKKLIVLLFQVIGFAFLAYFVWRCGKVAELRAESYRKWHLYLIENGVKESGEVTQIIDHKNIGDSAVERYYTFLVSYYSHFYQEIRQFETMTLTFIPEESRSYLCNVYEAQGGMIEKGKPEPDIYRNYYSINPFLPLKSDEVNNNKLIYGYVVADDFRIVG